ncbi:MAG TPA: hypothetical protein VK699_21150 [Terriglobales bacterium]|jgi:hypothetical protein|nr:hypothetical protein [Terriglobales bacterium]
MKSTANIQVKSDLTEVQFEWLGFDGDDCFDDFHIKITSAKDTRRFDFGPCAVYSLRKLTRFFKDATQPTASGGFRHPDIRSYEMHRLDGGYRLVVSFEGSGLKEEFHIHNPLVQIDDEFLKAH